MTRIRKTVLWVCGLASVALVYNFDAIVGRWKFERMCKNEGGPRFYEPVEIGSMGSGLESEPPITCIEFPGAVDHVTSRGDRREAICVDDADRARFPY